MMFFTVLVGVVLFLVGVAVVGMFGLLAGKAIKEKDNTMTLVYILGLAVGVILAIVGLALASPLTMWLSPMWTMMNWR